MSARHEGVVLGVDVGGTKLAVGQVVGNEVVSHVEHPTPLSSMKEFRAAFQCNDGDRMVRGEEKRAEIW